MKSIINKIKTPNISLGAMWFGASISIAEILTGTYAASLGYINGFLAILIGHILGCLLLFAMAYLGAKLGINSMRIAKHGFGFNGACVFAIFNVIQLFGWGSVMIYNGGLAIASKSSFIMFELIAVVLTFLLIIWLLFIKKDSFLLNTSTVILLGLICMVLSVVLLFSTNSFAVVHEYTFAQVVEFSVAMPISWLPLIADYTAKHHKNNHYIKTASVASFSYLIGGCWMYFIGMFAMQKFGADDIYKIMQILPIFGVATFVIVMSTVVNTFLDGQSAGESVASFSKTKKFDKHITIIGICVFIGGFIFANVMFLNDSFSEMYQIFLGLIAAVFVPMACVLVVRIILFDRNSLDKNWDLSAFISWIIGFSLYEFMTLNEIETFMGISLPVIIVTMAVCAIIELICDELNNNRIKLIKKSYIDKNR